MTTRLGSTLELIHTRYLKKKENLFVLSIILKEVVLMVTLKPANREEMMKNQVYLREQTKIHFAVFIFQ